MKKVTVTLILCLLVAGSSFAQNNTQAMRFLTVNALVQYGQKLYDRGDYHEASAVFNHVLTFDGHQAQALKYLKNMQPQASKPFVPVPNIIVVRKLENQIVDKVDISDTDSLKKAIEAKKQVIAQLRAQIIQMRANIKEIYE